MVHAFALIALVVCVSKPCENTRHYFPPPLVVLLLVVMVVVVVVVVIVVVVIVKVFPTLLPRHALVVGIKRGERTNSSIFGTLAQ